MPRPTGRANPLGEPGCSNHTSYIFSQKALGLDSGVDGGLSVGDSRQGQGGRFLFTADYEDVGSSRRLVSTTGRAKHRFVSILYGHFEE